MASERSATGSQLRARVVRAVALLAGVVAVAAGIALPFAPVTVNQPTVSWPLDPQAPRSTALMLTTYQPRALDVRFSCRAARLAAGTRGGLLLSTVALTQPAEDIGLVVSVEGGRVTVDAAGTRLADEPLPPGGDCRYRVSGGDEGLELTRDGQRLAVGPPDRVPEVEALLTGLGTLPGGTPDDLSVRIDVDDQFSTSPTPRKLSLIALLAVALLLVAVAAGLMDRAMVRGPAARVRWRPAVSDVVVLVTLVAWLFLAPTTDDDGYYGAMAENVPFEGYVANYFQLFNQSFTPFTWVYVALSEWGQLAGTTPVLLRVPALVCGLLTWLLLRRFVSGCLSGDRGAAARWFAGRRRWVVRGVLAVTFLAWWVPQAMGVRPEAVVALAATGALLAVAVAVQRRRLAVAAAGVAVAALGFTAHPTG
ncbi:MAG: arabinosyltransferase domain-containing protein, partial [Pseudonocardiaceae bacterium]